MTEIHPPIKSKKDIAQLDKILDSLVKRLMHKNVIYDTFTNQPTSTNRKRLSFIKIDKLRDYYGNYSKLIVEPYSEDEGNEPDEFDDTMMEPNVKQVCESIFDLNSVKILEKNEKFPYGCKSCLFIQNLDESTTAEDLKIFLEEIPSLKKDNFKPEVEEIKIFTKDEMVCSLVKFYESTHCEKVYSYFNHPVRRSHKPIKNKKNEIVEFFYAYDKTDLPDSQWYAVVLRNLPSCTTRDKIEQECRYFVEGVKYGIGPMKVSDSLCAVVVVKDLDCAEKLCFYLNKRDKENNLKVSSQLTVQVHLHTNCSKLRLHPWRSHFSEFFKWEDAEREYSVDSNSDGTLNCNQSVYSKFQSSFLNVLCDRPKVYTNSYEKRAKREIKLHKEDILPSSVSLNNSLSLSIREELTDNGYSSPKGEKGISNIEPINSSAKNGTTLEKKITTKNSSTSSTKFLAPFKLPTKISNSHIVK